jgi:hypothetical protein
MIGTIPGESYILHITWVNIGMCLRVRTHIREGHPDFIVTADSWPAFLYPHAEGDIDNVEHGLFRSAILLKVRVTIVSGLDS